MRPLKFILGAGLIAWAIVACNKNVQRESDALHALRAGTLAACDCANIYEKDSVLKDSINVNLILRSTVRYKLQGLVFVMGNHTLTIEKGTIIQGMKAISPAVGGGLIISRGSKIVAEGTSGCPIIFTSDQASPVSGDWAGVVILGKAQTNNAVSSVEGINAASYPWADLQYGSPDSIVSGVNVNNDSSGSLRCVRIEYAGFRLAANNSTNGLTLAGIGRKTKIDYVEVFKANDDGFEFFGGCVNASHLIAVDALDDLYETQNGYTGAISFALGLMDTTRKDMGQSNGFESRNNSTGTSATPLTWPRLSNITIIGVSSKAKASKMDTIVTGGTGYTMSYGRARGFSLPSKVSISNSIFFGLNYGISGDRPPGNTTNPYGRPCPGCSVSPYFMPTIGQAARPYGAFPGGVDWTNPDGCSTNLWSRYN